VTGGVLNTSGKQTMTSEKKEYIFGETNNLLFFVPSLGNDVGDEDIDKFRFDILLRDMMRF